MPESDVRWADLREKAEAAREQLANGPREWPGRPSRQRLELFLSADPDTIIELLDAVEASHA
jgi:hypothetical protein